VIAKPWLRCTDSLTVYGNPNANSDPDAPLKRHRGPGTVGIFLKLSAAAAAVTERQGCPAGTRDRDLEIGRTSSPGTHHKAQIGKAPNAVPTPDLLEAWREFLKRALIAPALMLVKLSLRRACGRPRADNCKLTQGLWTFLPTTLITSSFLAWPRFAQLAIQTGSISANLFQDRTLSKTHPRIFLGRGNKKLCPQRAHHLPHLPKSSPANPI